MGAGGHRRSFLRLDLPALRKTARCVAAADASADFSADAASDFETSATRSTVTDATFLRLMPVSSSIFVRNDEVLAAPAVIWTLATQAVHTTRL